MKKIVLLVVMISVCFLQIAKSQSDEVPNENRSTDIWEDIDKGKPCKDFGMTDNLHARFLKKIVFSKEPIEFQNVHEEKLTNTFNFGDEIFFMAYFERSMYNQAIKDKIFDFSKEPFNVNMCRGREVISFSVNGIETVLNEPITYESDIISDYFLTWTGRSDPYNALNKLEKNEYNASIGMKYNLYVVPNLKKGENIIKFTIKYKFRISGNNQSRKDIDYAPEAPLATGEFKVIVNNEADIVNHLKSWKPIVPSHGFADAALVNELLNLEKAKRQKTPFKITIGSSDWHVNNDGFVIKDRTIVYYVFYKTENPLYYIVMSNVASQAYQGGGKYGRTVLLQGERDQLTPVAIFK